MDKDEKDKKKCTSSLHGCNDPDAPVIVINMLIACCVGLEIVFFKERGVRFANKKIKK